MRVFITILIAAGSFFSGAGADVAEAERTGTLLADTGFGWAPPRSVVGGL